MKITLAKSAGFCFGVKRALEIAFNAAGGSSSVYMLGDIVHNEDVIKKIRNSGIKKIKRLKKPPPFKKSMLLIRAHGISQKTIKKARSLGYKIIDATCPMVKEIHKIAKSMEKKGYRIIIAGDKNHDEVRGIIGQLKKQALVIDSPKNTPYKRIKGIKKAAIIAQSTQEEDNVSEIYKNLKPYIPGLRFYNTICRPTKIKQEEIKKLPAKNDVMIIIGSKGSANTRRLYEISKRINPKSFWIQSRNEIKTAWFKNARSLAISAGASTPNETIEEVLSAIKDAIIS